MRSFGWLLLVVAIECAGVVACNRIPDAAPPPQPPAVFSTVEVYDGHHLYEIRLKDGTHCVLWVSTISCDWNSK